MGFSPPTHTPPTFTGIDRRRMISAIRTIIFAIMIVLLTDVRYSTAQADHSFSDRIDDPGGDLRCVGALFPEGGIARYGISSDDLGGHWGARRCGYRPAIGGRFTDSTR